MYWDDSHTINIKLRENETVATAEDDLIARGWSENWKDNCESTINYIK